MTRSTPGVADTSSSTPVATSSHSRAPTGSGNHTELRTLLAVVDKVAVTPLEPGVALRATGRRSAAFTGDAPPRDMDLIDGVEHPHRVTREHVAQPGCEPATDHDMYARAPRVVVEREQSADDAQIVGAGRVRDPRIHRCTRERNVVVGRQRRRDRGHAGREPVVAQLPRRRAVLERRGDIVGAPSRSRRDEHLLHAGRVEQLACSAHADVAEAGDHDRGHRKSGPCSSRHPPLVGGTRPLPRTRTTTLTATAIAATSNPRWKAFIRSSSVPICSTPRTTGPRTVEPPGASRRPARPTSCLVLPIRRRPAPTPPGSSAPRSRSAARPTT